MFFFFAPCLNDIVSQMFCQPGGSYKWSSRHGDLLGLIRRNPLQPVASALGDVFKLRKEKREGQRIDYDWLC